jgi:hypothetical protein
MAQVIEHLPSKKVALSLKSQYYQKIKVEATICLEFH